MDVAFDLHTHTTYSDGKTKVEDSLERAQNGHIGLGISDHGPGHTFYGISRKDQKKLEKELKQYNKTADFPVLIGIEANVFDDGKTDIDMLEYEPDYALVGYHKGAFTPKLAFQKMRNKEKASALLTEWLIKTMENPNVIAITHPGQYIPIDLKRLSEAAEQNGVAIEINERHGLTVNELEIAANTDAHFLLSSDAHQAEKIGVMPKCVGIIEQVGLPMERIVNRQEHQFNQQLRIDQKLGQWIKKLK